MIATLALVAGCSSLMPQPPDERDAARELRWDRYHSQQGVEPITGPLTLEEALARAVKYNLERRVRQMEQDLASGQWRASFQDLLPRVQAQVERQGRSQDRGTQSNGVPNVTGDRIHDTAELGLSWSLLDIGLGYYNAVQAQQKVQSAIERRRKAVHTLMQDVRSAFWRTAAAQSLRADLKRTISIAEDAIAQSEKLEAERVRSPLESARYQRQLLESIRSLEMIDQELASGELELAALINAPSGSRLQVLITWPGRIGDSLDLPMERLESIALQRNADMREAQLQSRIARFETRKVLTRLFPNISFDLSARYDTDSYQLHQHWNEAGLRVSYNLLNVLSAPLQIELAEAGVKLADQRRMVMQMAVLSQVYLATLNWQNSLRQLQRAEQIWSADDRLARMAVAREQAMMAGRLDTVNAQASALLSQFRRYQSVALSQVAESRLRASLGLDEDLAQVDQMGLQEVLAQLRKSPSLLDLIRAVMTTPPAGPTAEPAPARASDSSPTPSTTPVPLSVLEPVSVPTLAPAPTPTPAPAPAPAPVPVPAPVPEPVSAPVSAPALAPTSGSAPAAPEAGGPPEPAPAQEVRHAAG